MRVVLNCRYLTVQNKSLVDGDIYTALKGNVYEIALYYRLPSINKDYLFVLVLCRINDGDFTHTRHLQRFIHQK